MTSKSDLSGPSFSSTSSWSKLPTDLLCEILRHLPLVDYLRFSAVCTSWHSAALLRRHPPVQQLPWLMIGDSDNPQQRVGFRSLSTKEKYSISLPVNDFNVRKFIGSSYGWLITTNPCGEVLMLNPLTGVQIHIPRPNCEGFPRFEKASLVPASPTRSSTFEGGYVVVAILNTTMLAIIRNGETEWTLTKLEHDHKSFEYMDFHDIAYIGGVVYVVVGYGKLFAWDISGTKMELLCSELPINSNFRDGGSFHLVELVGDLLLVTCITNKFDRGCFYDSVKIKKFKWDTKSWVKVKSLGSISLFLGPGQTLSFSTVDFPKLKANTIYFTGNGRDMFYVEPMKEEDIGWYFTKCECMGVYDVEYKMMDEYDGYDEITESPPPLWLSPSLIDLEVATP